MDDPIPLAEHPKKRCVFQDHRNTPTKWQEATRHQTGEGDSNLPQRPIVRMHSPSQ